MILRYTLHMNLSFGAHLFFQTTFGGIVLKCERTLERCNVFDCVSLKLELHKPWVESNASFLQFQSKRVAVIINPICCILCIFIWVVLWSKLSTDVKSWYASDTTGKTWTVRISVDDMRASHCTLQIKRHFHRCKSNYTGRQTLGTSFGKCSSNI